MESHAGQSSWSAHLPLYLTGAAAAATVVSIAAFEILLALALVSMLILRRDLIRWPPVLIPFGLWVALTIASDLASGDARAGLPQIKKLYIWLMLFLVYSAFRRLREMRWLLAAWTAGGTLSALWGFVQFSRKYSAAQVMHRDFYLAYVADRITGFMGHWMTFSGHMMIVFLLAGAFVLFSNHTRWKPWIIAAGAIIGLALVAAFTRSMWLGAAVGSAYLLFLWRRWAILALPVAAALVLLANPFDVRERVSSITDPHGDTDSNLHRVVTRAIGMEIISWHPWLGLGPEQVGKQYKQYIPSTVERPLPTGYYGHLHNIYIHYAAERGVPAMLALLWLIGQALLTCIRGLLKAPSDAEARWVLHGAIAVTIAVLFSGWYELNLGDSEVLGLFLAVLGVGCAAAMSERVVAVASKAPTVHKHAKRS
jgi:O-antigen ligase